jgi:hypothetical protein
MSFARDVHNTTVAAWDEARLFDDLAWLYDGAPGLAQGGQWIAIISDGNSQVRHKKEPRVRYAPGVVRSLLPQTLGF